MKVKYILHPNDYAIGQNESFYSKMAAKGWLLINRGEYFSRFQKADPAIINYQIALFESDYDDNDQQLSSDQITRNKENGFEYVTGNGYLNVFRSSEGSDLSAFFIEPQKQITALKAIRKKNLRSCLALVIMLFIFSTIIVLYGKIDHLFGYIAVKYQRDLIEQTAFLLFKSLLCLSIFYEIIYMTYNSVILLRKAKKGLLLNIATERKRIIYNPTRKLLLVGYAITLVLTIFQCSQYKEQDVLSKTDVPYLLLEDLEYNGDHKELTSNDNTVEIHSSLLSTYWDTYESIEEDGKWYWIKQVVYEMKSDKLAMDFIPVLQSMDFFGDHNPNYKQINMEGLDYAATIGHNYIAVKNNMAYYIFYDTSNSQEKDVIKADVLKALAEKVK